MSNYVVTDLHGRYDLWEKIINKLQPEDTLYCLGDCADRGPDGWKIIAEAFANPQVVYLKGNHEDFYDLCCKIKVSLVAGLIIKSDNRLKNGQGIYAEPK